MKRIFIILILIGIQNFSFSQESLKIVWLEKYEWKVLSTQEDDKIHVIEIIPGKDKEDNWSMLGQMMSIKGVKGISMDNAQEMMFNQTKENAPKSKLTFLEKDEDSENPWILFKIECPEFNNDPNPESQLWYIKQGETSLFVNFIALKKKKLKPDFVEEWSRVFKSSEIVKL
jgi:hypothetical protein